MRAQRAHRRVVEVGWAALVAAGGVGVALATDPVPTTLDDFFLRGSQPLSGGEALHASLHNCSICHSGFDEATEPYTRWAASMMGQAARDPIMHACLAIANQDVAWAGEMCLRCHAPIAWFDGRSEPPDGSALMDALGDFEGVSCSVCHRMVDPVYTPGQSPARDEGILAALEGLTPEGHQNGVPMNPHGANYVFDPMDYRRGPLDLAADWGPDFDQLFHMWERSPFHMESRLCATCHDVSNPVYERQPDGTYALGALGTPHSTQNKYDQFPIERTYSEWSASLFAQGPVELGGRFGGTRTAVSSCQDCHMPRTEGRLCLPMFNPPHRAVIAQHNFNGANSWVLRAVHFLYPREEGYETGLRDASVEDAVARNAEMMALASDLELTQPSWSALNARVVNYTGHKLPTGYHEGRRMWVNVKFFNAAGELIAEHGRYDEQTATLHGADTKVYEAVHGVDEAVAQMTGLPVGPSFHFVLNNKIYFDNRIPPMGFTNAAFAAVQAEPVGYTYADGQYWDDTVYTVPPLAARAEVRVYHQTTTREYIEFLRDENVTNSAGVLAYQLWEMFGKSPPTLMDEGEIVLESCAADWGRDGAINSNDISAFLTQWLGAAGTQDAGVDVDGSGAVDSGDIAAFLTVWLAGVAGGC